MNSNTVKANGGGVYLQQNSKLYLFKKDYEYPENNYASGSIICHVDD